MPLIDLTCSPRISDDHKRALASSLPHKVSIAVACAAEPYDGDLRPGDVIMRFHDSGPFDRVGLDVLVEVRSKWFEDRAADGDARAAAILAAVEEVVRPCSAGVYLSMPHAAWAQSD